MVYVCEMFGFVKKFVQCCSTYFWIQPWLFALEKYITGLRKCIRYFSVLYSGASAFSFFSMLYSHESHLLGSVPLSFFVRLTFCFLQFTDVGMGSWYDFQFSSSRTSNASYLTKISWFCVVKSLFWRSCALSNFLFNCLIFFFISSDWMQTVFINSSNLVLSFLFSNFSQLDSSLSFVTFTHRLAFLSSRLKGWLGFLMKKFIGSFLSICQFIFLIFGVLGCFLSFSITLGWVFGFIGTLEVLSSSANLLLRNKFFCVANELAYNRVFLAGFDAMVWCRESVPRF